MKLRFLTAGLAALAITAVASAQSTAPAALMSAVSASQTNKADYAFDISFESSKASLRAHYNPKATPHVTMIEPAQAGLSGDQRRVFDALQQQLEGISWCAGERMGRVGNVRLLREDADTASYSFQPTRESTRGQAAQFAEHLHGEMTLTKANPDVTALHIFLSTPFDPVPFVHLTSLDVAITCTTAPNGRRYAAQTISQTTGSAFGQNINERNVQHVSNLSAAP